MDIEQNEIDLELLFDNIIYAEPKPIKTYNITITNNISVLELFEFLLMSFTKLCKKLYGDHNGFVDLKYIRKTELEYINKYFNSMGINVLIDMFDENDNNLFMLKYFEYKNIKIDKNTMLDTLYMCLKSGNYVYKIRFEII